MVTAITPNIQSSICELSHDLLNLLMSLYNEVMKIFVSFQFKSVNAFSYVGLKNINSMYIQIMQRSIKGDFILNKVRIKRNSPGKIRRLCCPLSMSNPLRTTSPNKACLHGGEDPGVRVKLAGECISGGWDTGGRGLT